MEIKTKHPNLFQGPGCLFWEAPLAIFLGCLRGDFIMSFMLEESTGPPGLSLPNLFFHDGA